MSPNIQKTVELSKTIDSKAHTKYLNTKAKKPTRLASRDDDTRWNSYHC